MRFDLSLKSIIRNTTNGLVHGSVPLPKHRGNHSCVKVLARLKAEIGAERTHGSEAASLLVNALETAIKDRANIASPCRVCREVAPAVNMYEPHPSKLLTVLTSDANVELQNA